MKHLKKPAGLSTLLLVFVIASILALAILAMQLGALLGARRSSQIQYSQTAFFAAEGALYRTIQNLRDDPSWPSPDILPLTDSYEFGQTEIKRTISNAGDNLKIEITATANKAKRKLTAEFSQSETEQALDIILVIDHSLSMEGAPLADAKTAAIEFVNAIEENSAENRIGLVKYSSSAQIAQELTNQFDQLREIIAQDPVEGTTNIGKAIYEATEELDDNGRLNNIKVIILLSDGISNLANDSSSCGSCNNWPCLEETSGFSPDNSGTCCTDDAINQAIRAKNQSREYIIFSVLLNNIYKSDCENISSTETLGRLTLLRISSQPNDPPLPDGEEYTFYKETIDSDQLNIIYEKIAQIITSPEFFSIQEEDPEN